MNPKAAWKRSFALLGVVLVPTLVAGCEQMPEQFTFYNDTGAPVEFIFGEVAQRSAEKTEIAPGAYYYYKQRPVQLPGDWMFSTVDDEKQFQELFREGIILVDGKGRRVTLDVNQLRAQMKYERYRIFTMHIRPYLFEPAR